MDDKILLVDKPEGITSAKVVALIKRKFKVKVGHAGTLDPLATGLLIVLTGKKTKESSRLTKMEKTYRVKALLGVKTDTLDIEGKILARSRREISKEDLEGVLEESRGATFQIPPQFSAIKVGGKEAYKLARKGLKVDLAPREVKIHSLSLEDFHYPYFTLACRVSSGFYVRSLIDDIGEKLGVGATVAKLRRTKIGPYKVEDAQELDKTLAPFADNNSKSTVKV